MPTCPPEIHSLLRTRRSHMFLFQRKATKEREEKTHWEDIESDQQLVEQNCERWCIMRVKGESQFGAVRVGTGKKREQYDGR
uniref:Uncharacterized protein n=1 Tax=Arion vulgaris TaxID=1028688 RepID=A0A0B6ZTP6_9EUPU